MLIEGKYASFEKHNKYTFEVGPTPKKKNWRTIENLKIMEGKRI